MTEEKYSREGYVNPIPTTDIITEYNDGEKEGIVLIKRKNPPHGMAIPGGFAEHGLSLGENSVKEMREETGLEVIIQDAEKPFCVHSNPSRDPRDHMISVTYIAKGFGILKAGDDAEGANVYTLDEVYQLVKEDKLAFDHGDILQKYLDHKGYVPPVELAEKYETKEEKQYGKIGLVGRFRPLHLGSAAMLEAACENAEQVIIGVGSSNRGLSERNPFTAEETRDMIDAFLSPRFSNYEIVLIPDFAHFPGYEDGRVWDEYMETRFGELDCFVSANPWVEELLSNAYEIVSPYDIIPKDRKYEMSSTLVKSEMIKGEEWKLLVPNEVAEYIQNNDLDKRFRDQFGGTMQANKYFGEETLEEERRRIIEA